ncbi:MarR family winged helix-turn-helix transcriptional regulator [Modestobacter versicolor]|uniref:MarR family winged helix-turn-helix transcriptional regulator n=1 Tax=Modestobacter versicolor TaxID=429133 RepID=UPI0034DE3D76
MTAAPTVVDSCLDRADVTQLLRSPDRPVDGLTDVLGLLDDLSALGRVVDGVARRLDAVHGLRAGELQALVAVAEGAAHPRAVARRTGQVDEAGAATVGSLVQRGLLQRHRHPASPADEAPLVHLTEAGRVVLAQAEGLQIRALAALVQQLGDVEAASLRTTVSALGSALAEDRPAAPALRTVPPPDA